MCAAPIKLFASGVDTRDLYIMPVRQYSLTANADSHRDTPLLLLTLTEKRTAIISLRGSTTENPPRPFHWLYVCAYDHRAMTRS